MKSNVDNSNEERVFGEFRRKVRSAEVLSALQPKPGDVIVDCTLGLGGHASLLLPRIAQGGTLIGCDFDPAHVERARAALARTATDGATVHLRQGNFAALPTVLETLGIVQVNGILADLGVASPQIDDRNRCASERIEYDHLVIASGEIDVFEPVCIHLPFFFT